MYINSNNLLKISTSSVSEIDYYVELSTIIKSGKINRIGIIIINPKTKENTLVSYLSFLNVGVVNNTIIVYSTDNIGNNVILFQTTLAAGELLKFNGATWRVYDSSGAIKISTTGGGGGGGDASAANQTTIIGHIDGIETLIGTTNSGISSMVTSLQLLDNAIAGNELQVDVLTMPSVTVNAGTNLNTSALALEATLQSIKTSVELLDNAISGSEFQVDVLTMPTVTVTGGLTDAQIRATPLPISGTVTVTAANLDTRDLTNADVVTAELSAVDNAVLDAIAASVSSIDTDTTTIIGHVDGIETSLTTLNAKDFATQTTLALIKAKTDNLDIAISGIKTGTDKIIVAPATETKQDTIITALGTLSTSANMTTLFGHVDGLEGLIGTTNTNTGNIVTSVQLLDDTVTTLGTDTYTEAVSKGITLSAVRRDADTTLVNTTNEFGPLQMDANGRLKVEAFSGETLPVSLSSTTISGTVAVTQSGVWDEIGINDSGNSITVDNGGTFLVQESGAALTALQVIDNFISGARGLVTEDNSAAILAKIIAAPATEAKQDTGNTALSAIQTAVQIIDNFISGSRGLVTEDNSAAILTALGTLLTELQLKADLSETQPVSLISVPSHNVTNIGTFAVQETNAAAILALSGATSTAEQPSYTEAANVRPSTDLFGNTRTLSHGLISDSRESYNSDERQPLSMTSDARLRVSTSQAQIYLDFFPEIDFSTVESVNSMYKVSNSPWGEI